MEDLASQVQGTDSLNFTSDSISYALLASNMSVLCVGIIMIANGFFFESDREFTALGVSNGNLRKKGEEKEKNQGVNI